MTVSGVIVFADVMKVTISRWWTLNPMTDQSIASVQARGDHNSHQTAALEEMQRGQLLGTF